MPKPSVSVIGAGKVGSVLATLLYQQGYTIRGVFSQSFQSACELAEKVDATAYESKQETIQFAEVVLITTPDRAITDVVEEIVGTGGFRKNQYVFHTSGSENAEILSQAKLSHAFIGSMHPLQSFANKLATGRQLAECYFAIDGDEPAVKVAQNIIQDLGGKSFFVPPEERHLYHAAACIASNYLIALLHWSTKLYARWGLTPEESLKALMPLIQGTLQNVTTYGPTDALTGPISRGDTQTVANHLELLSLKEKGLYCQLGLYLLEVACEKKSLTDKQTEELRRILQEAKR